MAFLSMALVIGAVAGAFVAGGALDQGFAIEVAIVRGVVAFMAIAFAGYLGELVIVTAPKREEQAKAEVSTTSEAPDSPKTVPSPPQLMAPAASALRGADDDNEDDADVELRPAA